MSSVHDEGADCWGVLINPDKSPTPLLEQLCLGIAQVMVCEEEKFIFFGALAGGNTMS
jgi:hypothetical protein